LLIERPIVVSSADRQFAINQRSPISNPQFS